MATAAYQERVCADLAHDIIEGAWLPGSSRTIEDIQARFELSRQVAREIAKHLEVLRVVEVRRRLGLTARPPHEWSALNHQVINWKLHSSLRSTALAELTAMRFAIEPEAAAATARNASLEIRAQIAAWAQQLRHYGETEQLELFHEVDIKFHTTLITASGNPCFAAFAPIVETVLSGRVELGMYPIHPKEEALENHEAVAAAVLRGDADAAREAMRRIVDEVSDALAEVSLSEAKNDLDKPEMS